MLLYKMLPFVHIYIYIYISVDIVTDWAAGIRLPARGFFSFAIAFRPPLGPTQPPVQRAHGSLSPGIKRPGREIDHSPPSSAEIKNDGVTLPLPLMSS
jgi:hypothetical protein